jgi:hypothetical protein
MLLNSYSFYFVTIVSYSYSDAISASIGILYTLIFIVVLYYGYKATRTDTTDPTIHEYRLCKAAG